MPGPLLAAVLCALAGARAGDRVATVGATVGPGSTVGRALLAMSGTPCLVDEAAAVVVADAAHEVPTAVLRLAPGGRLVAVAADGAAARRVAARHGLELRHVQRAGSRVAWSAVRLPVP